jgi:hypothetical protein
MYIAHCINNLMSDKLVTVISNCRHPGCRRSKFLVTFEKKNFKDYKDKYKIALNKHINIDSLCYKRSKRLPPPPRPSGLHQVLEEKRQLLEKLNGVGKKRRAPALQQQHHQPSAKVSKINEKLSEDWKSRKRREEERGKSYTWS